MRTEASMESINDLVEHFRLPSSFHEKQICHSSYVPGRGGSLELKTEKWTPVEDIGHGAFGSIRLEREEDGDQRVVKVLRRGALRGGGVDHEREILAMASFVKHPIEFVRFEGWFEDEENIYISMEYCQLGDLDCYLAGRASPLDEAEAALLTGQVLGGLIIMHRQGFVHRDIKPHNIFLVSVSPLRVRIGDFGISKRARGETRFETRVSTPGYAAPEVDDVLYEMESSVYTYAVDIWSLGCVVYQLLTKRLPFPKRRVLERYCRGVVPFPKGHLVQYGVSEDGCGFVENLLQPEPEKRPTPTEAHTHRWLQLGAGAAPAASAISSTVIATATPTAKATDITEDYTTYHSVFSYSKEKDTAFEEFDWKQWIMDHITARDITIDGLRQGDNIKSYATAAEKMFNSLIMDEPYQCPPEVARHLSVLVLYDLVMLIDDSTSMDYEEIPRGQMAGRGTGPRVVTLKRVLKAVANVYTHANPSGIVSVEFLNTLKGQAGVTGDRLAWLDNHEWRGTTRIGSQLKNKILDPRVNRGASLGMEKPLLVIIITDGSVEGEAPGLLEYTLFACNKMCKEDPTKGRGAVSFQFAQVGKDRGAATFLRRLNYDQNFNQFVDCLLGSTLDAISEDSLKWEILPQLLLGAIQKTQ